MAEEHLSEKLLRFLLATSGCLVVFQRWHGDTPLRVIPHSREDLPVPWTKVSQICQDFLSQMFLSRRLLSVW